MYALVYLLQIFLDLIEEVDAIIDKSVGVGAHVTDSFPDGTALKNLIHGIEKIKNVVILQTGVACLLGPKSMDSSVVLARQSHKPKLISMQPSMVSLGLHSFCFKHVVSRFDWHTCVNMQFSNYMYYNYIHNVLSNALEITTDYWKFVRRIL